ncbi:MAG: hypothetical protein PHR79_07870 [Bacteroidales bacterium]|nr:hypothetical protein [Bacteroidales bacterium]
MKTRIISVILFLMLSMLLFGQEPQEKKCSVGEYQKDWALVVKDGLRGFIRNDGVEIVKPHYEGFQNGDIIKGIIGGREEDIEH